MKRRCCFTFVLIALTVVFALPQFRVSGQDSSSNNEEQNRRSLAQSHLPADNPTATPTALNQIPSEAAVVTDMIQVEQIAEPLTSAVQVLNSDGNYFLKVDLDDPRVRVRTMIANNDTGGLQYLNEMRSTLSSQGYLEYALVNADLFGHSTQDPCPSNANCGQGLTYIAGVDRTNRTRYGPTWQVRGNIGFDDARNPAVNMGDSQTKRHMTIGGGPRIVINGGSPTCQGELVTIGGATKTFFSASGEYFDGDVRSWCTDPNMEITAVGISGDGRYLFIGMSTGGKTIIQLAQWLKDRGAHEVLRFDSRTSSGMYHYEGGTQRFGNDSGRAVANALAIGVSNEQPPCTPNTDQVAVFEHPDYQGACQVRGIGDYSNPGAIGMTNDSISSIKVGGSVKAIVYENDNYNGRDETFTGDDPNLAGNGIGDNSISSMKVQSRGCNNGPDEVAVYADPDHRGACQVRGIGDYRDPGAI